MDGITNKTHRLGEEQKHWNIKIRTKTYDKNK